MGACRNLLPTNLTEEFAEWLNDVKKIETVATNAPFGLYGVKIHNQVYVVYERMDTHAGGKTVHASIYGPVIHLAREFLKTRKAAN